MRLIILLTIGIFFLGFISCNTIIDKPKTPEQLRMELLQNEHKSPTQYLVHKDVTLEHKRKLVKKATLFRSAEYADDGVMISGVRLQTNLNF